MPQDAPLFHALLDDDKPEDTNDAQTITYHFKGEEHELTLATNAAWQNGIVAAKALSTRTRHSHRPPRGRRFRHHQRFLLRRVGLSRRRPGRRDHLPHG